MKGFSLRNDLVRHKTKTSTVHLLYSNVRSKCLFGLYINTVMKLQDAYQTLGVSTLRKFDTRA